MPINTCLSIITLIFNGVNVPTKRHRGTDWIKQKPLRKNPKNYNMLPTRDPFLQRTYIDWKWGDGKRYFMQMESTESWSSNTQNKLWNKGHEER